VIEQVPRSECLENVSVNFYKSDAFLLFKLEAANH